MATKRTTKALTNGTTTAEFATPAPAGRAAPIATRSRARSFSSFMGTLQNPDPVLNKTGQDIGSLRELLYDAQVSGAVESRKAATLKLEWQLAKDGVTDTVAAAVIEEFLRNRVNMRRLLSDVLNAPLFGYQPIEVVWDFVNVAGVEYLLPRAVEAKPAEWFTFDDENRLRFLAKESFTGKGEELPPYSFLLPRNNASYDNPYGQAILSRCHWPVEIKKMAVRFMTAFAEKFGFPWIFASYPDSGVDDVQVAEIVAALDGLSQDAVGAFKEFVKVNVLPNGQSGSTDVFKTLIDLENAEISKAILYHGAAMDSTAGKLGNEDMADAAGLARSGSDKQLCEDTINEMIDWIYERDFPAAGKRVRFVLFEEEDVDKALAERDAILYGQGVRFTPAYYQRAYGLTAADFVVTDAAPAPGAPTTAQFAEHSGFADQDALDTIVGDLTPEQLQFQMEQMTKPIFEHIAGARTFSEAMEGLSALYPTMNTQDLMAVLERVTFVAETVGRAAATDALGAEDV